MFEGIKSITIENFDKLAIKSSIPVVIEFWSKNYQGCNRLSIIIEKLSRKYSNSVFFGRINIDEQPILTSQLGVGGLPCTIILKNGYLRENIGGTLPISTYENILNHLINEYDNKNKK